MCLLLLFWPTSTKLKIKVTKNKNNDHDGIKCNQEGDRIPPLESNY